MADEVALAVGSGLGGFMLMALILFGIPKVLERRRHRLMITLLASLSTLASAHREVCWQLISESKHRECPLCHVDKDLWDRVGGGRNGWMHMVAIAAHRSWLDPEVPVTKIVRDQFMQVMGKGSPS